MPKTINGKPVDEAKWKKAKALARKEGHANDYAYIMGIYKKMTKKSTKSYSFLTDQFSFTTTETKAGKEYYITGFISTSDLDRVGDIVTEKALDGMLKQLQTHPIKLDLEHEEWRDDSQNTGPLGVITEAKRVPKGIWVKAKLNQAWKRFSKNGTLMKEFSELWTEIKNGFFDAFSIAFQAKDYVYKTVEGVKTRLLNGLNLLNVALTGNPVNPECRMISVFTKSLEEIDKEVKMAEDENVEAKPEETTEEKPVETTEAEKPAEEAKPEEPLAEVKALQEKFDKLKTEYKSLVEAAEKSKADTEAKSKEFEEALKKKDEEIKSLKEKLEKPMLKGREKTDEETKAAIKQAEIKDSKSKGPLDQIR